MNLENKQLHINYAGFWNRVLAAIIDTIILVIAGFIIGALVGFLIGISMALLGAGINSIETTANITGNILGIIIGWLYFAKMEASEKQATFGKSALGIRVVNYNGGTLTFGQATGRHFAKIISTIILFIGYIMVGFTEKKQGLHDIMAGALVIKN